jgi:hypothetical protein
LQLAAVITRKKWIISAKKQKPPPIVHFVFRSEVIPTFSDPTSRFGAGLLAETEPFTTIDILFSKPSHESSTLQQPDENRTFAAALAAIDQALDTSDANTDFLRSLSSWKLSGAGKEPCRPAAECKNRPI